MRPETFYTDTAADIGRELADRPPLRAVPTRAGSHPISDVSSTPDDTPIAERLPAFMARLRDRQRPPDIIPELVPGTTAAIASEVALHERILAYLRDNPGTSGSGSGKTSIRFPAAIRPTCRAA